MNPNAAKNMTSKHTSKKAGASAPTEAMEGLKIEEKVERKNINVLEEYKKMGVKKTASFVVVGEYYITKRVELTFKGHVDHGKSTLMGRLLLDLKVVSQSTLRKYQKEADTIGKSSFALAWVMDAGQDERERGITVDTATRVFETDKTIFTIIDAPGHQDFIPNMIAGASQADFALLVIDAGLNSFESGLRGQTREHALLVRSLGVKKIVVVVNKMDRVNWDLSRFREIKDQMSAFLSAANFPSSMISFVPCSGLIGTNISKNPDQNQVPEAFWYKGPTLVEEIDSIDTVDRAIDGPLRLKIDSVFRSPSAGWVQAIGRIDSGNVQVGDKVVVQPSGERALVKAIEINDSDSTEWAVAGQIASLRLVNIEPQFVSFGDLICDPKNVVPNKRDFKAKILTLEHVMPMFVEVHSGRLHVQGRIERLVAILDKSTGDVEKKHPRVINPGNVARVRVVLAEDEREIPLEAGWRIVLRTEGVTIATGLVE
jgi:elongation factor 1 alpha-like protein